MRAYSEALFANKSLSNTSYLRSGVDVTHPAASSAITIEQYYALKEQCTTKKRAAILHYTHPHDVFPQTLPSCISSVRSNAQLHISKRCRHFYPCAHADPTKLVLHTSSERQPILASHAALLSVYGQCAVQEIPDTTSM